MRFPLAAAWLTLTFMSPAAATPETERRKENEQQVAADFRDAVADGQSDKAMRLALQLAELQRQILKHTGEDSRGDACDDLRTTLTWIATQADAHQQSKRAAEAWAEIVEHSAVCYGGEHWKTIDARLALARSRTLAGFTPSQHELAAEVARLVRQSVALRKQRKFREAISAAQQAAEIRQTLFGKNDPDYATSLASLAGLHYSLRAFPQSLALFEESLAIRKRTLSDHHPIYASSLVSTGSRFLVIGNVDAAERFYRLAFAAVRPDHPGRVKMLRTIGIGANRVAGALLNDGDFAGAESAFQLVLSALAGSVGDGSIEYATAASNLGSLYRKLGEYIRAESLFTKSRGTFRNLKGADDPAYAACQYELGLLYERMGEYAKAEPLLVEARDIRREKLGEEHRSFAESLNSLALLYHRMSRFDLAEQNYRQARTICAKGVGEQHPDFASATANLGLLLLDTQKYEEAQRCYEQALAIRAAADDDSLAVAGTLDQLAKLHRLRGEPNRAVGLHDRACAIYRRKLGDEDARVAWALHRSGTTQLLMNDAEQARQTWEEALHIKLAIADRTLRWLPESQAAAFLTTLTTDDSSGGRDPLLSAWRHLPDRSEADLRHIYDSVWDTRGLLYRLLAARRREVSESVEADEVIGDLRGVQQRLAQLALAPPPDDEKARSSRQRRLAELNDRKETLGRTLARLSVRFRRDQENDSTRPADLASVLPRGTVVVDFVRARAWSFPAGKFEPSKQDVYEAFVLRPDDSQAGYAVDWIPLGDAAAIDTLIDDWRLQIQRFQTYARGRRLGRPKPKDDPSLSARLRRLTWDKIAPHLQDDRTVLLIPDGALNRLPWAALPGGNAGEFLVDRFQLVTASSGQQICRMLRQSDPPPGRPLLVGGVDYDGPAMQPASAHDTDGGNETTDTNETSDGNSTTERPVRTRADQWDFLPGTQREVDELKSLWKRRPPATLLTGREASETNVRREITRHRYVHLATHGFFADARFRSLYGYDLQADQVFGADGGDLVTAGQSNAMARNPLLLSGLLLAGANRVEPVDESGLPAPGALDDGRLTAEEVVNMDLRNVELAVLSACDTGLGKVGGGEGVYGLQRAFHLAGVRTTVASLWQVDDKATHALMSAFYTNLWTRKLSRIESLRQAQLAIRHRDGWSHPYAWASFGLSGDWRLTKQN